MGQFANTNRKIVILLKGSLTVRRPVRESISPGRMRDFGIAHSWIEPRAMPKKFSQNSDEFCHTEAQRKTGVAAKNTAHPPVLPLRLEIAFAWCRPTGS